jgi:hypothetical protein
MMMTTMEEVVEEVTDRRVGMGGILQWAGLCQMRRLREAR